MSKSLEKDRETIGRRLRELREARRLTQVVLARRLSMSQGRLSQIEAGKRSLTAEELLAVLRLFQVSVSTFGARVAPTSELQSTLARLGAPQLHEDPDLLPSERLERVTDAIRETLIDAESPRLLTALAPVIVRNIERINWPKLTHELHAAGLERRFLWLVENVVAAVEAEVAAPGVPLESRRAYRRALAILGNVAELADGAERQRKQPRDVLDRAIRTQRTRDEVFAAASPISRRWGIVTSLQPTDFVEALRGARVGSH